MPNPDSAVPFATVLSEELDEIEVARAKRGVNQTIPRDGSALSRAERAGLFGLAFSGGGIRSATFNLGVLQALAGRGLLAQIDYLSTVSGGGYIGSWFLSLLKETGPDGQVEKVQKSLSPSHARHPDAEDQRPIEFLRQYSNYLTPRLNFYSADVWTMAATWFRNALLNFLLLTSSIGTALILPRLIGMPFGFLHTHLWRGVDLEDALPALGFFIATTVVVSLNLSRKWRCGQTGIQLGIVVPLLLGTAFLARWLRYDPGFFAQSSFWTTLRAPWIFFAACFACIIASTGLFACFRNEHPVAPMAGGLFQFLWTRAGALALLLLASIVPGFVVSVLLCGVASAAQTWRTNAQLPWALLAWGPAVLAVFISLGTILLIGLLGLEFDTRDREWLSRLRAWTLIYSLGWVIIFGGSIYGPLSIVKLITWHPWTAMGLSLTWVVTTAAGVLSGNSSETGGKPGARGNGSGGNSRTLDWIARIAPFVFMIGFILAITFAIHWVTTSPLIKSSVSWLSQMDEDYFGLLSLAAQDVFSLDAAHSLLSSTGNLFGVLLLTALLLSFRLDINVFSFHEFYKNRLVRCYLGAVRCRKRRPDRFTGFDSDDDRRLKNFTARGRGNYYGPYPIINTTMNVSSGENLAWQERKSIPFIFTPLFCGYNVEQGNEAMRMGESPSAEKRIDRDTSAYAYRPTAAFCYPKGVHLGTAMAVSGAATSPNQGYHTSTAVAFLMTVFDVRLGWWVGNPRRDSTYRHSSPRFNLGTLSRELFGLSDARSGYVNLSDGGHFDNMGLYELIRRRCRYIVVSDAEQDPDLAFASLTTTIRNCRTDFGVEIRIALDRIKRRDDYSRAHCVVGTIEYPSDPDNPDAGEPGHLLYLKSSLTGDEPADVLGYHTAHPEFPHQSTVNQWFNESQFEAYRKVGQHIAETAIGSVRSPASDRAAFFRELQSLWYPPSERVEKFAGKHAGRFTDLTLALAGEHELEFLDQQVFAGWDSRTGTKNWQRNAIYRAGALIEFMETVYSDLNLESKQEREHPHTTGWLRIFEHWVDQPIFQEAWRKTRNMYGERFQQFYEDLVKRASEQRMKK